MPESLLTHELTGLKVGASGPAVDALHGYLAHFGWLRPAEGPAPVVSHDEPLQVGRGSFDDATAAALSDFQAFHRLPVTGRLDPATLELIGRPRCGMPDRPTPKAGVAEFVAAGTKWDPPHLGWHLTGHSAELSVGDVRGALYIAYRTWCLEAGIEVHEGGAGAEVEVRFATTDHGDGWSFDGIGSVLAHAFYPPPNGGAIAGDLHFDEDETWSRDLPPSGVDLDTIALHEAGHTLGLDHSSDPSAVMYAYYNGTPRRELTADDIAGMRSLYGERTRNKWTNLDAAVDGEAAFAGKAYMFKGSSYVRYDWADDLPDPGYAAGISPAWRGLPAGFTSDIQAAANGQAGFAGKLYLFKGDEYVRYDWAADSADEGYPKKVEGNWPGLPAGFTSDFDAAVSGVGPFAGKLYLFKGDEYVRYDWAADSADAGYPKKIAGNWPGLPAAFTSGIQAALNGRVGYEGKLYFFKGDEYVRYDWAADNTDPNYPQPIVFNWL